VRGGYAEKTPTERGDAEGMRGKKRNEGSREEKLKKVSHMEPPTKGLTSWDEAKKQ